MIPLYDHESEKWLIGALLTDAEVQKQLPTRQQSSCTTR